MRPLMKAVSALEVTPLAFESLGVRSSSMLIQTEDVRIVIDPAVALAPNRYGLPPHPLEEEAKERLWGVVKEEAVKADILIVTHYHFDHVDPKEMGIVRREEGSAQASSPHDQP